MVDTTIYFEGRIFDVIFHYGLFSFVYIYSCLVMYSIFVVCFVQQMFRLSHDLPHDVFLFYLALWSIWLVSGWARCVGLHKYCLCRLMGILILICC